MFLFITSLSHNVNTLDAASCHCVWEPKEEKKKNQHNFPTEEKQGGKMYMVYMRMHTTFHLILSVHRT